MEGSNAKVVIDTANETHELYIDGELVGHAISVAQNYIAEGVYKFPAGFVVKYNDLTDNQEQSIDVGQVLTIDHKLTWNDWKG